MPRKILHIDLDAFFCAAEELRDPTLAGKAFAVGGRPEERGVVASCSYAARQKGVRSAMPMVRAQRLCPELIVLHGRHGGYAALSEQVMSILGEFTPLLEQISIDEAFLDLSDLPDPPESLARQVQSAVHQRVKLPCSLGAASNKLVAKIACDYGKSLNRTAQPPNAITVVPPGQEAAFLAPMPVSVLWGVGPKTAARLEQLGVKTVGELAAWSADDLAKHFGKLGPEFHLQALGIDDRQVITSHEVKSISQETTFALDLADEHRLHQVLREQAESVGRRLRTHELSASTVRLKIRWSDFSTHTRQHTLVAPTDQDELIYTAVLSLFHAIWKKGRPVRLIGVGASNFRAQPRQLSLWEAQIQETNTRQRNLQHAVDEIRQKYGRKSIKRGIR